MILLGILLLAIFIGITWAFLWSSGVDAASWNNPYDRLTHPYSTRSKVLCIVWLISVPALFLSALNLIFG